MDKIVEVEIFGQRYKLKVEKGEEEYIHRLSSYVDEKMRKVALHSNIVDTLKIAVLAALNIADEKFSHQAQLNQLNEALKNMENSIESLEVSLKNQNKFNLIEDVS
ncbi:MAG: cell division protein ZapA [Candidatus Aminicenantia bacterium]